MPLTGHRDCHQDEVVAILHRPVRVTVVDIVLFDFDGTIADSGPTILAAATQTLGAMGYPLPDADRMRQFVGPPITLGITDVLQVPESAAAEFLAQYRMRYRTTMLEAPLYDGIGGLLESLAADGWTLGIASSKRQNYVEQILAAHELTDYFAVCAGADADGTHANKQAVIGHALVQLNASTETDRIFMVGDRRHDIDGAAAHGIPACMVTWGYGSADEATNAAAVVHSPAELHSTLTRARQHPIR